MFGWPWQNLITYAIDKHHNNIHQKLAPRVSSTAKVIKRNKIRKATGKMILFFTVLSLTLLESQ